MEPKDKHKIELLSHISQNTEATLMKLGRNIDKMFTGSMQKLI